MPGGGGLLRSLRNVKSKYKRVEEVAPPPPPRKHRGRQAPPPQRQEQEVESFEEEAVPEEHEEEEVPEEHEETVEDEEEEENEDEDEEDEAKEAAGVPLPMVRRQGAPLPLAWLNSISEVPRNSRSDRYLLRDARWFDPVVQSK